MRRFAIALFTAGLLAAPAEKNAPPQPAPRIGQEISVARHLNDDEEYRLSIRELLRHGKLLFDANWTEQEGGGRPLMKGTGKTLSDPSSPLVGSRAFNRVSAPDANSCYGCHNMPFGMSGGGGDFVAGVFVLGQRFDFVTFDPDDRKPTRGAVDEKHSPVSLQSVGNLRASTGMFGAGYLEMLARQMTAELQAIRDNIQLGQSAALVAKGIHFGMLSRRADGIWDVSQVEGLPRASLVAPTPLEKPNLIVRPWHQAGNVVSLREFSNNAFHHHHGIQTTERFGRDTDLDGDGFANELTRADLTAVSLYQAALAAPGRVIPREPAIEAAVLNGERVFSEAGCARCHVPSLPLDRKGWVFSEPNPYNPPTNLRPGDARAVFMDLNDPALPSPRLTLLPPDNELVVVPAYTDFKLHDIMDPAESAGAEPLDMNQFVWSPKFRGGNRRFLTKRLWGCANEPPYFHHGLFTTLRQAVLGHHGEALVERRRFQALPEYDQDSLIEFLKSLQVLPAGTKSLIVDEEFNPRVWPPAPQPAAARN